MYGIFTEQFHVTNNDGVYEELRERWDVKGKPNWYSLWRCGIRGWSVSKIFWYTKDGGASSMVWFDTPEEAVAHWELTVNDR